MFEPRSRGLCPPLLGQPFYGWCRTRPPQLISARFQRAFFPRHSYIKGLKLSGGGALFYHGSEVPFRVARASRPQGRPPGQLSCREKIGDCHKRRSRKLRLTDRHSPRLAVPKIF